MQTHVFIISTMSFELTSLIFKPIGICLIQTATIQKFEFNNKQFWISIMDPVLQCMGEDVLPYTDKCVVIYHKHDVLSCLRVKGTLHFVEKYQDKIDIVAVNQPILKPNTSLVKRQYNKLGFLRNFFTGDLENIINKL
jgi:hypothetical protein